MEEKKNFGLQDNILATADNKKVKNNGIKFCVGDTVGVLRCGNCNCVRCWKAAKGVITEICDERYVKVKKDCCGEVSVYELSQVGRC